MTVQPHPSVPATNPIGIERRVAPRFPIVQRCFIRPLDATGVEDWRGIAYNISTQGVGVALSYRMPQGTVLVVQPADPTNARAVQAKVIHATLVEFLWFHGCELQEPLTDTEVATWLR